MTDIDEYETEVLGFFDSGKLKSAATKGELARRGLRRSAGRPSPPADLPGPRAPALRGAQRQASGRKLAPQQLPFFACPGGQW
jgi:hypothetical protein